MTCSTVVTEHGCENQSQKARHVPSVCQTWGNMISIHCNFAMHLLSCQNLSLLLSSFQLPPLGKKNQVRFDTLLGLGSGVLERLSGRFIPGFISLVEFESAQVTEKKRTVYQMALSKRAHVCQWMCPEPPPLCLTHLHQVCLFPHALFFGLLMSHFFSVSLLSVSSSPVSFCLFYSSQIN